MQAELKLVIDESKIDRIVDFVGMFKSIDELQEQWHLSNEELELLKIKAEMRYGKPVFQNS